jgi:universal stress protein E
MDSINNILVALSDTDDAPFVLEKVLALAKAAQAQVHVVRIVYEGIADLSIDDIEDSARLKSLILESAESALEELVDPLRARLPGLECATLWNRNAWEGVLHAAEAVEADLIIKGATLHEKFGDVVRTPDDWNLLRHATVPVMLVKPQAWVAEPVLLCAVDPFDEAHVNLNAAMLREGRALADLLGGELHVVCAYPLFEPWVGELGAVRSYAEIKESVEREIIRRIDAIAARAGVKFAMLHAEEGYPTHTIGAVAEATGAELVIVGTHAREGVRGLLLGNTSERILHAVATDVLTMHGTD